MLDHETIVRRAFRLQSLPQSCVRLAALMNQPYPEANEITEVISYDPVLTAKLLRVANSAYYSSRRSIGTVKQAVVLLGSNVVFGLAIGACAAPTLEQAVPGYDLSAGELWQHSTTSALAADLAQKFCSTPLPPLAFTSALLHDLGKLVLGPLLTPELRAGCQRAAAEGHLALHQAEVEILSLHHGEVSGIIAQHWNLPPDIVSGVTYHHAPEQGDGLIGYATHLANAVARQVTGCVAHTEADARALEATRERLGITRDGFAQLTEAVAGKLDDFSRRFV